MKNLREQIEVMQAAMEGKRIEYRDRDKPVADAVWMPVESYRDWDGTPFRWTTYDYRIAPEPLELWANVSNGGWIRTYTCPITASEALNAGERTVHMREVLDEPASQSG